MSEDANWSLAVALYIRDVLVIPDSRPFSIPPVVPAVPESNLFAGSDLDIHLAGEWALWFCDLMVDRMDMGTGQPIDATVLARRSQGF